MFPEKEASGSCGEENALLRSVLTVVTSSFWAPLFRTEHFKALCWVAFAEKKETVPGSNEIKLIFVSSTSEYHYRVHMSNHIDPKENFCLFCFCYCSLIV